MTNEDKKATDKPVPRKAENPYTQLPVAIGDDGKMMGLDVDKLYRVATMLFRGGFFRQHKSPESIATVLWAGHGRGWDPITSLQHSYQTDGGTLAVWGDAPIADLQSFARGAGHRIETFWEQGDDVMRRRPSFASAADFPDNVRHVARVVDVGSGETVTEEFFSVADAKLAKLWPTCSKRSFSVWFTDPTGMLYYRCMHRLGKRYAPQVYAGLDVYGEPLDTAKGAAVEVNVEAGEGSPTDLAPIEAEGAITPDDVEVGETPEHVAEREQEEDARERDAGFAPPMTPEVGEEWTDAKGRVHTFDGSKWVRSEMKIEPEPEGDEDAIPWDEYPVRRARGDKGPCRICGEPIEAGDSYIDGRRQDRYAHEGCVPALSKAAEPEEPEAGDAEDQPAEAEKPEPVVFPKELTEEIMDRLQQHFLAPKQAVEIARGLGFPCEAGKLESVEAAEAVAQALAVGTWGDALKHATGVE